MDFDLRSILLNTLCHYVAINKCYIVFSLLQAQPPHRQQAMITESRKPSTGGLKSDLEMRKF